MKISKKSEYALKALIALAIDHDRGNTVMLINDVAQRQDIPKKYLEHILLSLRNAGILVSKRGAGGGYSLSRSPENISLGDIIRVVEGPLEYAGGEALDGSDEASCGLYSVMAEVGRAVSAILDNTSLKDVANRTLDLIEQKNRVINYAI